MSFLRGAHVWILWALGASSHFSRCFPSCSRLSSFPKPAFYALFLSLLIYEPIQRSLIYLHRIRIPRNADFSRPELYGFAPGKVRPFTLETSDGATLGAWLVLPQSKYLAATVNGVPEEGSLPESVFDEALRWASFCFSSYVPAEIELLPSCRAPEHPVVVYYHGNAATRAAGNRVRVARHVSDMDASFLIIDYRFVGPYSSP
jgi:abhydrolase domain-containing protein 12